MIYRAIKKCLISGFVPGGFALGKGANSEHDRKSMARPSGR